MAEGLRVVRGPDWNLGNEDRGEGHVGTVVKDNGDQTYDVYWDMGGKSTCRVGKGGKFDLRILDNAPVGVKHLSQRCEGCQKNTIIGVLWRCASCNDANLCTPCYYLDKHDLSHPFQRIDKPHGSSVPVPKRSNSVKMKALGIFPGAKVVRGPNWDFGTQDGGSGKKGKVEDLRGFGSDVGGRNAVRVRWETSGEANVYRVGCRGKVDLQCVEEAPGGSYYREHLPVVGKIERKNEKSATVDETSESLLKKGDKCVIDMPEVPLKELQRGHGGWSIRMSECIGEIGVVKNFPNDSTVEIEYKGKSYQFHAGAVRKVYDVKVGDVVQVLKDETKAILLQRNHGGWNDDMKKSLGKVGKVVKIDSDGDVAVAFGNQAWVFNPGLLTPVKGGNVDVLDDGEADNDGDQEEEDDASGSQDQGERVQIGADLAQLMAHLLLKGALGAQQPTASPEQMFNACANGNIGAVNQLIQRNKDLVNSWHKNLTPLMVAGHQGHENVVKLLLQNGAHINASNKDGMTPLMVSISGKETDSSICLIKNKADVNACNNQGRTPAHFTVQYELYSVLKAVLEAGASPNRQDVEGDTPLHDAIAKRSDRAVNILLSHPQINLKLLNKKGHIPLMWAAMKDHEFAVERLIEKEPSLVHAKKSDGYTALHIAVINDHQDSANILILKGKAQVNAQNQQGLSPLHLAAHEGYDKMAKILIENGADVDLRDNDGDTPLHLALGGRRQTGGNDPLLQLLGLSVNPNAQNQERYNMAVLMLQKGADFNINNKRGNSPLEVCRNGELKRAVTNFIQKHRTTSRPSTGRSGASGATSGAEALQELLLELPISCVRCKDSTANTRLLPCKHKVLCVDCSFKCRVCPVRSCNVPISDRCDLRSIRYFLRNEDDYIVKEKTLAINCTGTDNVCLVQSFVNTFSAMASFFWTAIIMLHILMTLHKMEDWTNRWKIVAFNILSWGIPLAITIAATAEGALGEDFSISTGPWCWIKGCLSPTTVIMWMSVTGKFWEVLTYLVSMLFYLGSKYLIWRRTRTQTYSFGENSNYNLRDEDQLYTMIFLVLVPLRIFGTIRFFIAVHKSISNDNLVIFNHIDHVLLYFQSVGDSGQAFCNAILFCLKDRVVRRGLLERLRRFCGRPTYGESERLLSNNYVS